MTPTKMTLISVAAVLTLFAFALLRPSTEESEYQYGVLKSDPPMPPLTYTWSHLDCPFTANFPGKPEEEMIEQEDGTKLISISFQLNEAGMLLLCSKNLLDTINEIGTLNNVQASKEISKFWVEDAGYSNAKYIENLKLKTIPNYVTYINADLLNEEIKLKASVMNYITGNDYAAALYVYPLEYQNEINGIEFFETIKLK